MIKIFISFILLLKLASGFTLMFCIIRNSAINTTVEDNNSTDCLIKGVKALHDTHQTICNEIPLDREINVLTLQNQTLNMRSLNDSCTNGLFGELIWIAWSEYERLIEMNNGQEVISGVKFIVLEKAYGVNQSNKTSNLTQTYYQRQQNVLIERLPIAYELRNIRFGFWKDIIHRNTTHLGQTVIRNGYRQPTTINGTINYLFQKNVNLTFDFSTEPIKRPLIDRLIVQMFSDNGTVTNQFKCNREQVTRFVETKTFLRHLPAQSKLDMNLFGQWIETNVVLEGSFVRIFDRHGDNLTNIEQHHFKAKETELKIVNIHLIDGMPIDVRTNSPINMTGISLFVDEPRVDETTDPHPTEKPKVTTIIRPYVWIVSLITTAVIVVIIGYLIRLHVKGNELKKIRDRQEQSQQQPGDVALLEKN